MDQSPLISIVVPCYDEEANLSELYRRLTTVLRAMDNSASYEIVLVNDGSSDRTWPVILSLINADSHVVGVNLAHNHGHQLALSAGLKNCKGQRIFILDADLQDPPELLPDMMGLMDQGADVVYGQRLSRRGENWFKKTSAALFYRCFNRLADVRLPLDSGDFRLLSRRCLNILNAMPEQHRFIRGMVGWIGMKQVALPYHRQPRFAGATKYSFGRMLHFAADAVTGFSIKPLRLATYLGGFSALVGIIILVYSIMRWVEGDVVAGWTSLIATVVIMGSTQLLVLGVFGEYLGRLYIQAKQRPLFVVESIVTTQDLKKNG